MLTGSARENVPYPLTFGVEAVEWLELQKPFEEALKTLAAQTILTYQDSKKAVASYFHHHPLALSRPICRDEDAMAVLDTVFQAEEALIRRSAEKEETYRRLGRHIREFLADDLCRRHLDYLNDSNMRGEAGARELAHNLGLNGAFESPKALQRLMKKIAIYREVGSLVHTAELSLSTVKVRVRSGARAERGNLWPQERREKYRFLESLSDAKKVCPPFTEEDLEFLVSQSSLEMLQKKSELLLSEIGFVEPNRLKANYARLREHLQRSQQRQSDCQLRRELLLKLGASEQQIDYISARATYQTMKNLLKLSGGKIAISDLMGGKRTIRKLLRRRGKAQSSAEEGIARYLVQVEGIERRVADSYARTRKNHSLSHLKKTLEFLKENYRHFYKMHWGFTIQPNVLRRALEFGLSRHKLSKRSMSSKDFLNDLRRSLAVEEAMIIKERNTVISTPDARRAALAPLKEVLDYETDTDTKKQLYFIYEQFCRYGFCIPKEKLKEICLKNPRLFPSVRKVQDALEILNGAYRCIGQHGETLCVLPDYLRMPQDGEKVKFY